MRDVEPQFLATELEDGNTQERFRQQSERPLQHRLAIAGTNAAVTRQAFGRFIGIWVALH